MKKRTGVAAASMIGTGFAAWVITANATANEDGQFRVDTVSEKTIEITPTFAEGEGYVNFLAPAHATSGWLTNDNENPVKLSTVLTVNYSVTGTDSKASDFQVQYKLTYDDGVAAAIAANYITAPVLKINNAAVDQTAFTALTSTTTTDTVSVTIEFGWGSAFGGVNPYTFYNTFAYDDTVTVNDSTNAPAADENSETKIQTVAKTALNALADDLTSAKFTVTINAKSTSNN